MNRVLQPRPLIVLGLNVWMGTAAGADELVAEVLVQGFGHVSRTCRTLRTRSDHEDLLHVDLQGL